MRLFAFQGTRYVGGDPGRLAAPPFDQIDPRLQRELHSSDPCHFAHLTRPLSASRAANLLDTWEGDGTVVAEGSPRLYAYEILFSDGGTRRLGLCGLVGIEPPDAGVILPHESTVDKTIDERLELLSTTECDLEPILMLCQGNSEFEALLEGAIQANDSLAGCQDELGNRHQLFPILDAPTIQRFREILAPSPGWIADGHHRYRTASEYARRNDPKPGTAARAKLAVITSLASPGLQIDPIHRGVSQRGVGKGGQPIDLEAAGDAVRERQACSARNGAELACAVAAAPQPAIGVWATGRDPELWLLDPGAAPTDLPEGASRLAAALVHGALYPRFGLSAAASTDGTTVYRSNPDELANEVRSGKVELGIWLPPTSPQLFSAAVEAGDRLPPKWTRFVPKLCSGLVWCSHKAEIA